MDNEQDPVGGHLTWEIFADIWQLPPSDRRRLARHFDFLDKDVLRNDAVFYPAVLERMRTDPQWAKTLFEVSLRSPREKDKARAFSMRALKWLKAQIEGLEWDPNTKTMRPDPATWSPLQQEVYELWAIPCDVSDHGSDSEPEAGSVAPDWLDRVSRMQAALAAMTTPDLQTAHQLAAWAEDLVVACEFAAAEAGRAADLGARRAVLSQRLGALDFGVEDTAPLLGFDWVDSPDTMAEVEGLVANVLSLKDVSAAADIYFAEADRQVHASGADPSISRAQKRQALDAADAAETAAVQAKAALREAQTRFVADLRALATAHVTSPSPASDAPTAPARAEPATDALAASDFETLDREAVELEAPEIEGSEPAAGREPAGSKPDESPASAGADLPRPLSRAEPLARGLSLAPMDFAPHAPAAVAVGSVEKISEEPRADTAVFDAVRPAAIWTGRQTLDEVTTQFLDRGELALAWHLAELAEEKGLTPPVPAGLLRSLVAAQVLTGPYDAAAQTLGEWLASAMSEVEAAEARGQAAGLRARTVALAMLLRPALMARDTNAREHLSALSLADGLQVFGPVVALLIGMRYDLQPSLSELTELAGGEKQRRLPAALAEIRDWLNGARKAQGVHAPTGVILHKFVDAQGDLGTLFEAALAGQIASVDEAHDWLLKLSGDRNVAEEMVAAAEMRIGRPRRDAIKGMALGWIVRKLREGAERLLDWRAAHHADRSGDTRQKDTLGPLVNEFKKELGKARRQSPDDLGVDSAVQRLLDRAVADFLDVIEGRSPQTTMRPTEALEAPLLLLPGLCQPYALEDRAFDAERRAQRQALFSALQDPDTLAHDEIAALRMHLKACALLPARTLLDRLERRGNLTEAVKRDLGNELDTAQYTAREETRRTITGLRHDLEPLQSIDLATSPEIQLWLDRLGMVDRALDGSGDFALPMKDGKRSPVIPPDFPHLALDLAEAYRLRDRVRDGIRRDQRQRLEGLANQLNERGDAELADEAFGVARSLETRDPITVEDILIRLQDGQSFTVSNGAQVDHFSAFYPGFVAALTANVDTVSIQAAMKSGGTAGPLNYQGLEEHEIKRAVELDAVWRALGNAFQKGRDTGTTLRSFMERLGFTSVAIERETQLSAQLRWMWMRVNRLSAQDWFLPPVFGSEADGSYPIFLAHRQVDDAQLVAEMAKIGRDAPCILLVFGRLSKVRRESFGLAMRKAKQTVLLIDEAQVLFLTMGGDWMQRLFACAAPFGYLQPYTTSAGNIPVEMFFGRESEIAKIESATADGCLVYGGRQLGKSALLHHVRKRFHQPAAGRRAYYLKIDEFGGAVQPASQIWSAIRGRLIDDQVLPKSTETPDDIRSGIRAWLGKGSERRVLLLVDEADLFLGSEARSGFPNLNPLKDMMEETSRRFKVVFAGLHNVRRMAKAPNSPLVHLSDPICIGPLNTSPESSQQARRLVVEPMKAAGFVYEAPDLIHSLLTRVNFYPSLMQVFLKALLEGLSNQSRPQGVGPRWILREEQLFRGPSSEGINSQIRERFQWTLNLDPRYELIAKVVARHRILSADAEGGAMAADDVQREAELFWPKGQEKLGRVDFPAFLDEMVDLGVLIRLPGPRGLYGLRGAQVAQMLGQLEQLDDEILKIADKEPRVDYDPNHYHRRVGPDHHIDRRAPLPDRTLAALFDPAAPGVRILIAAPAVLGSDQAQILADLAEGWNDGNGLLSGEVFRGQEADLRRLVGRPTKRRRVLVLQAQGAKADWITWLGQNAAVREGRLLPVFVGAPDVVARLWPREATSDVRIFRARPWERTMLRAWLSDSGLSLLDTPEIREALLDVSGGAPAILGRLRPSLEALITAGRRDDTAARLRELGEGIAFTPAQVGLADRLVPLFCNMADLVDGAEVEVKELLDVLGQDNGNAAAEIGQMTDLGLFQSSEPSVIALSPLGGLLHRACDAPRRPG
jgi:hypothetical protein